ncbi:MAG: hypothetical protein OXH11_03140 [Candidatus Aminicenantes bacterium]|nr:hypothetical protein [Candidatus Aminicenantes bacterium]
MIRMVSAVLAAAILSVSLAAGTGSRLPGTRPLRMKGDLSLQLVEDIDRFLLRQIADSPQARGRLWSWDYSSPQAYLESIERNRDRFRRRIGAVDDRLPAQDLELVATLTRPSLVAENRRLGVYAVRWPVLDGVDAEGLLVEPAGKASAQVVVIPDADWTPEMLAGLDPQTPPRLQAARILAEAGCRVLVPVLIDRRNTWSGNSRVRKSNQTHREFIYRQAYFMGRHLLGYEVQKVLAALDYFARNVSGAAGFDTPLGIAGHGEGGLVALYAAALDPRARATLVSGYFQPRERVWQEPVYRNVWGLLQEFGDAEIASLIAPRALMVEACRGPEVPGPPPPRNGRMDASSGKLATPPLDGVRAEFRRAREHFERLGFPDRLRLVVSGSGKGPPFSPEALEELLSALDGGLTLPSEITRTEPLRDRRADFDPATRMERQYRQLVEHCQQLMRLSSFRRQQFWSEADASSLDRWARTSRQYREHLWHEIIGWLPPASVKPNPRTRQIYETDHWKGYEVVLDTWPGVFSYGVILVPRDLKPRERRPVVVAQHGRAGRPQDVCDPAKDQGPYHAFGAQLADRGFVVYAPQNLYIGEEKYRALQRKANPLKLTFFAPMVRQHQRVLEWLATLPFVDADRIGFYGLSYGGKSAMLIPAVLENYALSICSGDFNEAVWKHVSIDHRYSFMLTKQHEHSEFDFGEKFNYAEIAGLIAPRPFMVERGHRDGVGEDEWVAFEYAKVRRLYVNLGIGDRTRIEFFDGGHEIHGKGTFEFLHRHLRWPAR